MIAAPPQFRLVSTRPPKWSEGWQPGLWPLAPGMAIVLLAMAAAGCRPATPSQAETPAPDPAAAVPTVKVVTARMQSWPRIVRVQGSLIADEHAVIGAKVAGRIKQVNVDIGSEVRRGDVLVTLEDEELTLKVKQAEAQLHQAMSRLGLKPNDREEALDRLQVPLVQQAVAQREESRANLERAKLLIERRAMAVEELQERLAAYEVAEARYRSALNEVDEQVALIGVRRAELALASQTLTDATVRAPFDGIVQHRQAAPGVFLQVGQAVVTMVRNHPLRFRAGVPERDAVHVELKQGVQIHVEGRAQPISGEITRFCPALDVSSRALCIEVDVPNPQSAMQAGLFAEAEIVIDPQAQTLSVPAAAISEFAGVEKVWLVRDGKAAPCSVQTGRRASDRVEILRGLSAGDLVASDGRLNQPGPVKVQQAD